MVPEPELNWSSKFLVYFVILEVKIFVTPIDTPSPKRARDAFHKYQKGNRTWQSILTHAVPK
jgi:hypothetical protein